MAADPDTWWDEQSHDRKRQIMRWLTERGHPVEVPEAQLPLVDDRGHVAVL